MNSASLGKTIYLGLGPVVYLGLWILAVNFAGRTSLSQAMPYLFFAIALSGMNLIFSFLTLKVHTILFVPIMKRSGIYNSHSNFTWVYALMVGLPAIVLGLLTSSLSCSTSTGENVSLFLTVPIFYTVGWFMAAGLGLFVAFLLFFFLVPTLTELVKFMALFLHRPIKQK